MHILFILAHPEVNSFNGKLVKHGQEFFKDLGHTVEVLDLYSIDFDPLEKHEHYENRLNQKEFSPLAEQRHAYKTGTLAKDIQQQIQYLNRADLVVFQFPIWWHSVPAMLKGWMDRVFISGGTYSSKMRYDKGYYKGKRALCSFTTGAPKEAFVVGGRGGAIDQILWSTQFSLYYMGFEVLPPLGSFGVAGHGYSYVDEDEFTKQFIKLENNYLNRLSSVFEDIPLEFPGWKDWDDLGQPKISKGRKNDGNQE